MTITTQSSGDLTADRRAEFARQYADSGDFAAAADLIAQALEMASGHLPFMALQASWLEKAGRCGEGAEIWREVLRSDPADRFGAQLKLAALGVTETPDAPPAAYVESLFDDFAPRFERSLVGRLDYDAPRGLARAIAAAFGTNEPVFRHAVDLGCGTGLMGEYLRKSASFLEGIDLSAGMLRRALDKRIYDRLEKGDVASQLPFGREAGWADLAVAADVYAYLGELTAAFGLAAALLEPGGLFAFTVEAHGDGEDYVLQPSLRYAHGQAYLRRALGAAGFDPVSLEKAFLRLDGEARIDGYYVVARLHGADTGTVLPLPGNMEENENIALGGEPPRH